MGRERRGEKPAVRGQAGAANGERGRRRARRGGAEAGAISAGAARRPLSAAERSSEVPTQSRQAARRVRGGARAAKEARRADGSGGGGGGGERSARGCGSRRPRRRLLLQEEPKGHRPCPLPASGHRCSLEAPRGLACVKVSGGWGRPRGCGLRPLCATPRAVSLRPPRLTDPPIRAGFDVTPSAPLLQGAAPPCALGRDWKPRAAEVPLSSPSGASLRCAEASGVWGRAVGVERLRA